MECHVHTWRLCARRADGTGADECAEVPHTAQHLTPNVSLGDLGLGGVLVAEAVGR